MHPPQPVLHYCQTNRLVIDPARVAWKRTTFELRRDAAGRTSVAVDTYWSPATVIELAQCVSDQTGVRWVPSLSFMDCCALYTSAPIAGETITLDIPWIFPKEESDETDSPR